MEENKTVTRREAIKLAGMAATLGAGLGVVAESAEAAQEPGMLQHKGGLMQFKFYAPPDASGRQELLFATPVPGMIQKKLMEARDGRFQIKVELYAGPGGVSGGGVPGLPTRPGPGVIPPGGRPIVIGEAMVQLKLPKTGSRGIRR